MGKYSDFAVVAAIGVAVLWLVRMALRSGRRAPHTEVPPVSEQWLAERRAKHD